MIIFNLKVKLPLTSRSPLLKGGLCYFGFTIMEVLISLVVLGLILVGILSVFVFSSRQGSFLRRRLQAIDFARETLETLKNQVRADSWSTGGLTVGTHATAAEDLPVGTELKDTWSGTRMYSVDAGVGDTRKVTVTVQWNEP